MNDESVDLTFERDANGETTVVPTGLGGDVELVLTP